MSGTLTAYYDLAVGPVSFDVIAFLVKAKTAQIEAGCEQLHVVVVPDESGVDGMFRDKLALYDADEMGWRLWNLVVPACRLVGASVTLATNWAQAESLKSAMVWPTDWRRQNLKYAHHHAGEIIAAARAGAAVPRLQSSPHAQRVVRKYLARFKRPVITMTMRNTYDAARNADVLAWEEVRGALADRFDVIGVADTAQALVEGSGYAELNLDLRLALYEQAAMNLHGADGPSVLCWYSSAPFMSFNAAPAGWEKHWRKLGLDRGDQLPWARGNQRLVYHPISVQDAEEIARWAGATS